VTFKLVNKTYQKFTSELTGISGDLKILNETDFDNAKSLEIEVDNLHLKTRELINKSISPEPEILTDIISTSISFYDDFGLNYDINHSETPELARQKYRVKRLNETFELFRDYSNLIDSLKEIEPPKINSIGKKQDYILEKLSHVFNDNYYDISLILKLNNISYRTDEPSEIADDLDRRGYVVKKEKYSNKDGVRLTVKGANYIERKLNSKKRKNEKKASENSLNEKIDEILQRLNKLGLGQEIIYDDFEEMRLLQEKLTKKSWSQLLKGKLFDLTVSKLLNKETANFIYEFLTNEKLKFLE
jgi:predicted transcriptional regulator